jgi:2-polyprenyl-3-methyl-5-hydroxy-6-metoxy-1,4-benzoquinol methylase
MELTNKIHVGRCFVCGESGYTNLFSKKSWNIVKCPYCGFVYVNPRYSDSAAKDIYDCGNWFDVFNYDSDGRKDYSQNELASIQRAEKDISNLEIYKGEGKILDIGCGLGYFLDAAKKQGWEEHGIDPSSYGIGICKSKGHDRLWRGTLGAIPLESEHFDVVTAFDVYEHVSDPINFLDEVYRILKVSGIFIVAVPNVQSLAAKLQGSSWSQFILPEHLNYFSSTTLITILNNNGFDVINYYSEPSITIDLRKWIRSNCDKWIGSAMANKMADFITSFKRYFFYPPINFIVKKLKIESNLLVVHAKKKKISNLKPTFNSQSS